mgnify:FL=1
MSWFVVRQARREGPIALFGDCAKVFEANSCFGREFVKVRAGSRKGVRRRSRNAELAQDDQRGEQFGLQYQ